MLRTSCRRTGGCSEPCARKTMKCGVRPELIEQALAEVVGPTGAQMATHPYPRRSPVVNDPMATEFLSQVVTDHPAQTPCCSPTSRGWRHVRLVLGACARFVRKARGSRSGIDRTSDLHASTFDIDERAIAVGIRNPVRRALSWLRSQ